MNILETGELLARIQVHDNRNFDKLTIEEWQMDLADVSYSDALQVVREHRKTSTDYLTANHVIQGVKRMRAKRIAGIDEHLYLIDEQFPDTPEGTRDALAARRVAIARIANGEPHEAVFGKPRPVEARRMPNLAGVFRSIRDVPDAS